MEMITVTAKTLDEAITKALIQLGTTSDNLEYTVIEKGSAGFLGFIGKKDVVIQAKKKKENDLDDIFSLDEKKSEPVKPAKRASERETKTGTPPGETMCQGRDEAGGKSTKGRNKDAKNRAAERNAGRGSSQRAGEEGRCSKESDQRRGLRKSSR